MPRRVGPMTTSRVSERERFMRRMLVQAYGNGGSHPLVAPAVTSEVPSNAERDVCKKVSSSPTRQATQHISFRVAYQGLRRHATIWSRCV